MLVMQEPMNTSSILAPATSDSVWRRPDRSGSRRSARVIFVEVDLDHGCVLASASALAASVDKPVSHCLDATDQRTRIR